MRQGRIGTGCVITIPDESSRAPRTARVLAVAAHQVFILDWDVVHQQSFDGRHELVVAFQCGVRFGAIDDHAGVRCIAHLLERERIMVLLACEIPIGGI